MRNLHAAPLLILIAVLISACTTQLTEAGKQINLVTASSANACHVVKAFTVEGSTNGDALNTAFNKAAEVGADSVSIVDVRDGGKMQVAALNCRR
ncbi:hypothetical protein [Pseudomonas sp.]|uniref:hypothetical protein n=1 Tax=Pseudomonas sp. TaxID=306 RepID=UPI003FD8B0E7